MREINMDLRVIRTKNAIRAALVELIEEKGFETITVKDITTKAKINRGTFYAHYQDKFDLMTKCQEEIMQGMSDIAKQNIPDVIAELGTDSPLNKPFTVFVSIFEYLNVNSEFMKAALGPKGDLSFQTKIKDFMLKTLFENDHNSLIKEENLLVPGHFLISYIASAHIGVIQQWLDSERKESPQEMARILSTITVNGPFFAAGLKK
ncbi:TetR/AcrR family transcriptional regulator [Peribacillus frigoritolerans]|uniref:TetR/AcrR family transcriptional regulator n=1 Tax=Peribacillus frigoritolerans TaxID=450367 RepID=UPI0011437C64|nr:TetR/AcrR family transcriptional regulator [Peribacillus frigoritolerans]MBD8135830.1 TetR/AcrR family transcriptional regulator [Bacillus sp. CFBP 13597]MCR8868413.1 TetR/AcrR family transcriptional regulator [Peribacillus frigoritolerans]